MKDDVSSVFIDRWLKWAVETRKKYKIHIQQVATASDIELKRRLKVKKNHGH